MTELSALHIKITGDSGDLKAAMIAAEKAVSKLGNSAAVASSKTTGMSAGLGRLGSVSKTTRGALQNVGFQLQDIVVQLQMGTAASRVLAQQLPQMAQSFGAFGAIAGAGIGLAIPAIALAFDAAAGGAKSLEDAVSQTNDALSALKSTIDELTTTTLSELQDKYGEVNQKLIDMLRLQRDLALNTAFQKSLTTIATAVDEMNGIVNTTTTSLQKMFNLNIGQAWEMTVAFNELRNAVSPEDQIAAYDVFIGKLKSAADDTGNLSKEAQEFFSKMVEARLQLQQAIALGTKPVAETVADIPVDEPKEPRARKSRAKAGPPDLLGISGINGQIAKLKGSLRTQEEIINDSFVKRQAIIGNAVQNEVITHQEANEMSLRSEREFLQAMEELKTASLGKKGKQEQAGPPDLLGIAGMNEQLDALREAMRTQEEIVADAFLKRQQTIGWAVQNERMTHQEAYQMSLRSEQQFREQMAALQANQYQAAYDRQGEMLLTEKERIGVWYAEQLELLMNYYNARGTLDEAYYTRLEQLKIAHDERMAALERAKEQTQHNMVRGLFSNLLTITKGGNKKLFETVKMAAIAEATVSGIKAAVDAWEAGMSIGGPTAPATAALYAAASLARTGAMISQLKSASFSGGGGSGGAGGGATAAAPAAPTVSRNVAIQLTGGDMYSREQVVGLINSINEAVEDGAVIRLV